MKYYHALILANADVELDEHQAPLLRMEMTFGLNDEGLTAENVVKGVLHDLRVSNWMSIADIEQVTLPAPESLPPLAVHDDRRHCDTCHKVHGEDNTGVFRLASGTTLYPEHEYIIETKSRQQKYVRRWRMGYMGTGIDRHHLVFSARGPDRTHSDQYGGDVTLDTREILGARQVPKDVALRHTGQEVRAGGRAT